jgi:hypothetical protein
VVPTSTGEAMLFVVVPTPSWPNVLFPQAQTVWSFFSVTM